MEIYIHKDGANLGPFTPERVKEGLIRGEFRRSDHAWHEGQPNWMPLADMIEITGTAVLPPDLPFMPSTTRSPAADRSAAGVQVFAGFWVRFAAYVVDGFVMYVPYLVVKAPLLLLLQSLDANDPDDAIGIIFISLLNSSALVAMYWLYFAISEASRWQATVGKKLLGLQVVDLQAQRLTFGRASGRYFAKLLSFLTFGIGCVMVGFTERKQGLHDLIAGTLVLRRRVDQTPPPRDVASV